MEAEAQGVEEQKTVGLVLNWEGVGVLEEKMMVSSNQAAAEASFQLVEVVLSTRLKT